MQDIFLAWAPIIISESGVSICSVYIPGACSPILSEAMVIQQCWKNVCTIDSSSFMRAHFLTSKLVDEGNVFLLFYKFL